MNNHRHTRTDYFDIVQSYGHLAAQNIHLQNQRHAVLAEAETSRALRSAGVAPHSFRISSRFASVKRCAGYALIRMGTWLQDPQETTGLPVSQEFVAAP